MVDINSPVVIALVIGIISAIVSAIIGAVVVYRLGKNASNKHIKNLEDQLMIQEEQAKAQEAQAKALEKQVKFQEKQTKTLEEHVRVFREQNESLRKIADSQEKRIMILGEEIDKITRLLTQKHQDKMTHEKRKFEWNKLVDVAKGAWALYKEFGPDDEYE
jgi:septal ring factor EnvC (AmiA/AmiB activator)